VKSSAGLAGGLGIFFALATPPAKAAISAEIPPECGSLSEFEQELDQRLGSVSTAESTRITLTPEPDGYHLVVEAGNQRRELHDPSCQELLHAAVVIALALLEPKREEASPPPPEPPPATPPLPPAIPETHAASNRSHPKVGLGAGGGIHVGTLPQATLLLEFDAQLKWTRFGVAAGLRYLLPNETTDETGRGVRVAAAGASLAGLFEPWQRLQFRLGVATYRLSGSGIGGFAPRNGSAWELSPTLGATFTPFGRPPFWTALGLEGQFNLLRPSFEILHYYEVFQVSRVSGSAFARAGVVF
jgi:hypothetical protein